MTDVEHPDDGHTADDLRPHGWAPGGYSGPCRDCDDEALGAKRIRCCRACAVKSLEAWRAKPVVIERREFWWITSEGWGHTTPTPAEVTFRDDVAHQVCAIRADEIYRAADCVLIERVRPPGQVEALSDAMWQILDDMGEHGQGACLGAKAHARIAYETFRVDADGEEAPLDYPLEAAQAVVSDLEWQRARMAGRDRP